MIVHKSVARNFQARHFQANMVSKPSQLLSGLGFVALSFALWGAACLLSGQIIWA